MGNNVFVWSRYNFVEALDNGEKYLYNSYSNCLLSINEELYNILRNLSDGQEISSVESCLSKEEIEFFAKNFIFVNNDEDLVDLLHMHSMSRLFSRKNLVLTIAPTQACNFDCKYCYENWRQGKPMTDQTANSIVNYIKHEVKDNGLEKIALNWYGGEPLLQFKRIISLAKEIAALNVQLTENLLITNGYYFNKDTIPGIVDCGIKEVQITLDGDKITHDQRRPLKGGEGTFNKIIENLDYYFSSEYKDNLHIHIRVNVDQRNCETYLKHYQWLNDRYNSDCLYVYPGIIVLDDSDESSKYCLSRNDVTTMFLDLYKKYGIVSEKMYPDDINIECMARSPYSNMLIGPDGSIYKCFEELGDKNKVVGNINNPEVWSNYSLMARYTIGIDHYSDPICRKCKYLPICRGGCPIQRYNNVYNRKHNDCCCPFKGRIKEYISIYSKIIHS